MNNKMKALALGLFTSFATVASAQSNDNNGKLLADASMTKTEISNKENLAPVVRKGGYVDAVRLSRDNEIIVVYISGAKGTQEKPEKYTAKQYGQMLQKGFANPKYTNNPTDIVVVYKETGEVGPSTASVIINGEKYKTKSGRVTFTPMIIGNAIDTFADAYAKTKGVAAYNPPKNNTGLALNNNN